jgi:hypothetical protein
MKERRKQESERNAFPYTGSNSRRARKYSPQAESKEEWEWPEKTIVRNPFSWSRDSFRVLGGTNSGGSGGQREAVENKNLPTAPQIKVDKGHKVCPEEKGAWPERGM